MGLPDEAASLIMVTYQPFDWYDQALYYDIIFDTDTPTEAEFLEQVQRAHSATRGSQMLEPACGSGRLVSAMAQRGYRVTGIDLSDGMLEFARQRVHDADLNATLRNADMANFHFNRKFDIAHCLVSTFKYLPDETAARSHLQCVADALKPGGIYVLGLHLSEYDDKQPSSERWTGERDGLHVVCNIRGWPADRKTRTEKLRSRFIVTNERGAVQRYETRWTFRTYDGPQLRRLLRSVPDLKHIATYDFCHDISRRIEFDGEQLDHVLILRKC